MIARITGAIFMKLGRAPTTQSTTGSLAMDPMDMSSCITFVHVIRTYHASHSHHDSASSAATVANDMVRKGWSTHACANNALNPDTAGNASVTASPPELNFPSHRQVRLQHASEPKR